MALASFLLSSGIGPIAPAAAPAKTSCMPTGTEPGPLVDLGVHGADPGGLLTEGTIGTLIDLADRAGASIISTTASWRDLRPDPTAPYDWTALDDVIDRAGAAGMRVRLQLQGMPTWAVTGSAPDGEWRPPLTEQELAAWSTFVSDLMLHVRGRVDYVEIWDEPNEADHWTPGPDPRAYSALLQASYPLVKRIDPEVVVVSGGLSTNDLGYLTELYGALDDSPGERRPFDMLGLHRSGGHRRMHDAMRDHGDGEKGVYVGELGYATVPARDWRAVDEATRSRYLTETMEATTCTPYVFAVSWHLQPTDVTTESWTLLDAALRPTQSYDALAAWAERVRAVSGE